MNRKAKALAYSVRNDSNSVLGVSAFAVELDQMAVRAFVNLNGETADFVDDSCGEAFLAFGGNDGWHGCSGHTRGTGTTGTRFIGHDFHFPADSF
jgi:hypothetical protein